MNRILFAGLAWFVFSSALHADGMLFGNAPKDANAVARARSIAETYQTSGIAEAVARLAAEVPAFLASNGATAQFDFMDELLLEAHNKSQTGQQDLAWATALAGWNYDFTRRNGQAYWNEYWTRLFYALCITNGDYGRARAVLDEEQARRIEKGVEIDVQSSKPNGPVDADFPSVLKRKLLPGQFILTKDFPYYVRSAEQDMREGKWRDAMETAALARDRAMRDFEHSKRSPNSTDSTAMVQYLDGYIRSCMRSMADGYFLLHLPWLERKAWRDLRDINEDFGHSSGLILIAKSRDIQLSYFLEEIEAGAAVKALEEIRKTYQEGDLKSVQHEAFISLMISEVHFHFGNAKAGWEIINALESRDDLPKDTQYQVQLAWCNQRVAESATEGVEIKLIELLRIAREGGLKHREIVLYELYARLLVTLGRHQDALFIQRELLRQLKSFDIFTRIPDALHRLAEIQAHLGKTDLAQASLAEAYRLLDSFNFTDHDKNRIRKRLEKKLPTPPASPKNVEPEADLQPVRSLMVPLEGMPARGLFTLTNTSSVSLSGVLELTGTGMAFREDALPLLGVEVGRSGGQALITKPVIVPAGSFIGIDLSHVPPVAETTVGIRWKPKSGEAQTAEWSTEAPEGGVTLAITDAAEYIDNPFYLIPIYHLFQYRDSFAQAVDVRVVASEPSRVEFYDSQDELVWVDADGDGAFTSPGDIISKDINRNGWGDIKLDPKISETRFRLFVLPLRIVPDGKLSLNLQVYEKGTWHTHAIDQILFRK
jgi:hypothetical protein